MVVGTQHQRVSAKSSQCSKFDPMQCMLAGGINLSKKSQHTANLIHAAKFSESANRLTQQNEANLTPCNKP